MEVLDDTFSESKIQKAEIKHYDQPSLKTITDYGVQSFDDKNLCNTKKIYSVDRMALNESDKKSSRTVDKSTESIDKTSKLFRTSSSTIGKDLFQGKIRSSKTSTFGDSRLLVSDNDLFSIDLLNMKRYALGNYIHCNAKAADLRWSLFCAACHSYRYDSVLRPFPPMFLDGDTKEIDKMRDVAESCPSVNVLYQQLHQRNSNLVSEDLLNLLYWVLIHNREPQLTFIPKDMHNSILSKVMSTSTAALPQYIFKVTYNSEVNQKKFNDLAQNYKIIHAFHGSRLDNFYSIIHYGLRISFNKLSAFGPGIYLSSEMNVSLPYSQTGFSWGASYLGSQISIVALCEMINHPDVKHPKESDKKLKFMTDMDSTPEKYYIVQNSDLVRVEYLLVYTTGFPENSNQICSIITLFQKNKVIAVVIAYVILLLAIAITNNASIYKYWKRIGRKLGMIKP